MNNLTVFTTAPINYDYGCNKEILDNCGTYNGKTVRMVQCYDKYRRDYQMGRYCSGMYFTRTLDQIAEDLNYSSFVPNEQFKPLYVQANV